MEKKNDNFTSIRLPRLLIEETKTIIKKQKLAHNTHTSYIEYAIRKQLDTDKQNFINEKLVEKHKHYLETIEKAKH